MEGPVSPERGTRLPTDDRYADSDTPPIPDVR